MSEQKFIELLRKVLDYDPETGKFTWIAKVAKRVRVGDEAGSFNGRGYRTISVLDTKYQAHRLAWLLTYGRWPNHEIDHINGDKSDNRLCNLRECTPAENGQNLAAPASSSCGLIGASWGKHQGRWRAQITVNGRKQHLGYFDDKWAAHRAYCEAKERLHTFNPKPRA